MSTSSTPAGSAPRNLPRGCSGRADLLQALALAGGDPDREAALAAVLGFDPMPVEVKRIADERRGREGREPATETTSTAVAGAAGFRPYRLAAADPVVSGEEWRTDSPGAAAPGVLTREDRGSWACDRAATPVPMPIVPWARLWPRLRQAVARVRPAGIDLQRLTARLAAGSPVGRLPRLRRLFWPNPLPVVLDFSDRLTPYWDDWHRLARQLDSHFHRRIRLYRLEGVPQWPLRRLERGLPIAAFQDWPALGPGDTLLLVSDLGMVDPARPWPRECWQTKLGELRRRGVRVVVLAPISVRHQQPSLINSAAVLRLSGDSPLRPVARRLAFANSTARAGIDSHPSLPTLLAMMSIATRVEPGLLRALRRCLPELGNDAGLEGEVWCHPELDTAATACALSPRAVEKWREVFRTLPEELQQRTLDGLRTWHAGLPQAIHHEETLLWRHLARDGRAEEPDAARARGFFLRIRNTLTASGEIGPAAEARALQVQLADRHVDWVAPTLGQRESYLGALSAAVARAEPVRGRRGLPQGVDPVAWLKSLPPAEVQRLSLLQRHDGRLGLAPARAPEAAASGVSCLAQFELDRPALLWAWAEPGRLPLYRPWLLTTSGEEDAPVLTRLSVRRSAGSRDAAPELLIHTGRRCLRLEPLLPPVWATALGQDHRGLYAELTLAGEVQRFRWIWPGTFLMGSPAGESERDGDETQHEVTLSRGYWLADTACTQALWRAVTGENPSRFQADENNPVEQVGWDQVLEFIQRLNEAVPELNARLPTEAEWEYACRAGTDTPFSFGAKITPEQVNYDGNYPYAGGEKGLYREKTVPVKALPPNPWGLYQMHGNVWEWCSDWFGDYPAGPVSDPCGPDEGSARVMRGGSWHDLGRIVRSAYRLQFVPSSRNVYLGFRLALGPGASGPAGRQDQGVAGRTAAAERGGQASRDDTRIPPTI